jgi:hypothetical protein
VIEEIDIVDRVVPEPQRRNLFRREYEGKTLRETSACCAPRTAFSRNGASKPEPRWHRLKNINACLLHTERRLIFKIPLRLKASAPCEVGDADLVLLRVG